MHKGRRHRTLLRFPRLHVSLFKLHVNDHSENLSEQGAGRLLCQPLPYRFQSVHYPIPHQSDVSERTFVKTKSFRLLPERRGCGQ